MYKWILIVSAVALVGCNDAHRRVVIDDSMCFTHLPDKQAVEGTININYLGNHGVRVVNSACPKEYLFADLHEREKVEMDDLYGRLVSKNSGAIGFTARARVSGAIDLDRQGPSAPHLAVEEIRLDDASVRPY